MIETSPNDNDKEVLRVVGKAIAWQILAVVCGVALDYLERKCQEEARKTLVEREGLMVELLESDGEVRQETE